MKSDEQLQKDVQDAIKWEPLLSVAEIGVTVKDGIVSLTGVVDTYVKKLEAETAAKNVTGVRAVVEKIEIRLSDAWSTSNTEIAADVLSALKSNLSIPIDNVKVKVEDGWITLEGTVTWKFEKDNAENAIKNLTGVKGVTNLIEIKPDSLEEIEKRDIEKAIARNWSINSQHINVAVKGSKVILTGKVSSLYQKDETERIVWKTPGIWAVDNELVVDHAYSLVN